MIPSDGFDLDGDEDTSEPTPDLDLRDRVLEDEVDMGAYEFVSPSACPYDCANGDQLVGTADLLALLAQWGTTGSCDGDGGGVGTSDLLGLLAAWGPCLSPLDPGMPQTVQDCIDRYGYENVEVLEACICAVEP